MQVQTLLDTANPAYTNNTGPYTAVSDQVGLTVQVIPVGTFIGTVAIDATLDEDGQDVQWVQIATATAGAMLVLPAGSYAAVRARATLTLGEAVVKVAGR